MKQALGAVLLGLLVLVGGIALRGSASPAIHTIGEVLVFGGAAVAAVGVWQVVTWVGRSRE